MKQDTFTLAGRFAAGPVVRGLSGWQASGAGQRVLRAGARSNGIRVLAAHVQVRWQKRSPDVDCAGWARDIENGAIL